MYRFAPFLVVAWLAVSSGAETLTLEIRHLWEGEVLDGLGILANSATSRVAEFAKNSEAPVAGFSTAAGETIRISRLAYLLSAPSLQTVEGAWLGRNDWFAYGNLEAATTRFSLSGLPAGHYTTIRFHLGLDEATDSSDPNQYAANHPLNPNLNKLHWTPQGGYIFLALEGYLRTGDEPELGFAYHVGKAVHRTPITVPVELDLSGGKTIQLDLHVDRLFSGDPPLVVGDQTSTHSRPGDPIPGLLMSRVQSAFTVRGVVNSPSAPEPSKQPAEPLVGTPYRFVVKRGFPIPALPVDFPLTNERVELGRRLFHDPILSGDNSMSCASCHQQPTAFTDGTAFSTGIHGEPGTRNAMPLFNLAWKSSFLWDGRMPTIREQVLDPIQDPVELHSDLAELVGELAEDPAYPARFAVAFGDDVITPERLGVALEQFLLTLTSYDSRFDRAAVGKAQLTPEEKRGFELFMTEYDPRRDQFGADCFHCHGGAFFSDHGFHNNGLAPGGDVGREAFTGKASDRYKFSTPSLRNVALTGPYMHDGRFETLEEVVNHYASGIHRSPTLDPNIAKHPGEGIALGEEDRAALVAFLKSLTDPQFR